MTNLANKIIKLTKNTKMGACYELPKDFESINSVKIGKTILPKTVYKITTKIIYQLEFPQTLIPDGIDNLQLNIQYYKKNG